MTKKYHVYFERLGDKINVVLITVEAQSPDEAKDAALFILSQNPKVTNWQDWSVQSVYEARPPCVGPSTH